MRTRIRHWWEKISSGYWFVPALMIVAATAAAHVLLYVDRNVVPSDDLAAWFYSGGSEGAKTLLSAIAGSVITVASVVFSITIAALTQASSQFGPRLLRNFMRDTSNQFVLGTFVATFVYCLLILRTIHGDSTNGGAFVPHASVSTAVVLAVASIAVLIYFIHHVAISLQAPMVVAAVRTDLEKMIARLPEACADNTTPVAAAHTLPPDFVASALEVHARSEGYVQAVDYDGLTAVAEESDLVLKLTYRAGDYVIAGSTLLWAWPAERVSEELCARLNAAFLCGRQETLEQDIGFGLDQMVEVAVRALSPGTNDPFTAINCADALGSAICQLAKRRLPGKFRLDTTGRLRIVCPALTFDAIVDTAFNQIRQYGRSSVAVTIRLLEVFAACAPLMTTREQRNALLRHAEMVYQQSKDAISEKHDRDDVHRRWEAATRALQAPLEVVPRERLHASTKQPA